STPLLSARGRSSVVDIVSPPFASPSASPQRPAAPRPFVPVPAGPAARPRGPGTGLARRDLATLTPGDHCRTVCHGVAWYQAAQDAAPAGGQHERVSIAVTVTRARSEPPPQGDCRVGGGDPTQEDRTRRVPVFLRARAPVRARGSSVGAWEPWTPRRGRRTAAAAAGTPTGARAGPSSWTPRSLPFTSTG